MDQRVGSLARQPWRLWAALLIGSGLAVGAAACSGGSPAASHAGVNPRQAVLASVSDTESASSAAIGITVSVNGTPSFGGVAGSAKPVDVSVSGHGLFSFADKTGEMTITSPSLGQGAAGTVQIEEIGNELYVSNPRLASVDGGKPWVEVNLSDFQKAEGQSSDPLGSLADGDPSQILGLLQRLGGSVSEVGPSDIDGVPTTEYRGQVDLAGSGTGSSTEPTIISSQLAQELGLSNIPVDVWVDSAGRARQVQTSFSVIGLTVQALADFSDFGTSVSVTAPPSDEVADGSSLLRSGQLGSLFD